MLNWISIIALAMAFFVSRPSANEKIESRPGNDSFSNESVQPASWEMDDPLLMILLPDLWSSKNNSERETKADSCRS
jgi:hypothetical protein